MSQELNPAGEHLIDLDADPFIPDGWTVEEHWKGGRLAWNPAKVRLNLSGAQKAGGWIQGHELREELKNMSVLNANILDYLFEHRELIPEEWKGKNIFFWGIIYRDRHDYLCVRYLYWCDGGWNWDYSQLDDGWNFDNPAAVFAS